MLKNLLLILIYLHLFIQSIFCEADQIFYHEINPDVFSFKDYISVETTIEGQKERLCLKSECHVSPNNCVIRSEKNQIISFSKCPEFHICQILDSYTGICVRYNFPRELKILYPGDFCRKENYKFEMCAYGPRECVWNRCVGTTAGERCLLTNDCEVGNHCSRGKCVKHLKSGEKCKFDDECGRLGACHYSEPQQIFGTCRQFFTFDVEGS